MNDSMFYMVWNPNRFAPKVKHDTEAGARAEAERLARMQPGDQFYVLCATSVSQLPVITTRLHEEPVF